MHSLNLLIDEILDVNKKIGLVLSECQSCSHSFSLQSVINLQNQDNFVCIRDVDATSQLVAVGVNLDVQAYI